MAVAAIRHPGYSRPTAQIYSGELESQPEFESFQDFLRVLPLCRGKVDVDGQVGDGGGEDSGDDDDDEPPPQQWDDSGKVLARLKVNV